MAGSAVVSAIVPDRFVLDGSVTIAWLFADEKDAYADAIIGKLPHVVMLVPRLWHLEVANVLLIGARRKRCSQADTTQWLRFLSALPVRVDAFNRDQRMDEHHRFGSPARAEQLRCRLLGARTTRGYPARVAGRSTEYSRQVCGHCAVPSINAPGLTPTNATIVHTADADRHRSCPASRT